MPAAGLPKAKRPQGYPRQKLSPALAFGVDRGAWPCRGTGGRPQKCWNLFEPVPQEAHPPVNWAAYIESDPSVMEGRPVLRDSQVPVDFLLGLLAAGWSEADVLANYPHLTHNHLRAVFAFAAESVRAMGHLCQADRQPGPSPSGPSVAAGPTNSVHVPSGGADRPLAGHPGAAGTARAVPGRPHPRAPSRH